MKKRSIEIASRRPFRRKNRRGAAAVEFAIVAPLLFLMVFGSIEFSRALMVQQVLTNASRTGARRASMVNATQAEVTTAASEYAQGASVSGVAVTVTPDPVTIATGEPVTVTVSVAYDDVSWIPAPWFMGGTSLTATSVMRKEGFE